MTVTWLLRLAWPLYLLGLWLVLALYVVLAWAVGAMRASSVTPRPGWRSWAGSWLKELRWAYPVFVWWQPFRAQAIPDAIPSAPVAHGDARTGVVLIHGFMCNRAFWTPWMRQLRAQGRPFVALSLEPMFADIDSYVPAVEDAVRRLTMATGRPPLLVAHSMGGLVARAWCRWSSAVLSGDGRAAPLRDRVSGVVTLGTPHQGTWLARFSRSANGRQMREGSTWLKELAAQEGPEELALFESWSTPSDSMVFPAGASALPGAVAHQLPDEGHASLAFAPAVWCSVQARLAQADQAQRSKPPGSAFVTVGRRSRSCAD